jgi:putative ABC transport system permease protein
VLAIRAAVEPMTLAPAVQAAVAQVDRDQTAHDFKTMDERVRTSPSVTNSRFFASLFAVFGALAILLAMVGVYGVMSWIVGRRTSEFGIRMALGARARDIVRMLLGQSLRPILVGLLLGTVGGYGLSRALNAIFFRMTTAEPLVFAAIAALMLAVALLAAWVPVRRVTRIDPQCALRRE